ncbi:RRN10 RNA polymerase I-specific transcription initiation factor RRN10 [Candida maltosa Xu316]|uniref:Uncharacterized protein n=1 Tax=Candida maltosa (strain Xu316) TaxID=1245528 RepID=M3IQH9_CANMX|nr:hypothetical protein G210_0650 [Candida maltosa Xu316]
MNINKKVLKSADIYNACNGEYREELRINKKYVLESQNHQIIQTPRGLKIIIDKDADDLDKVFLSRGNVVPPDEILDMKKPDDVKIPMKLREDFEGGQKLPDSDLLKAIHYFASAKFDEDEKNSLINSMDETALISMGLLIESWCDELVTDEAVNLFLERYEKIEPTLMLSDYEEEDDDDDEENSNEDEEQQEEEEEV